MGIYIEKVFFKEDNIKNIVLENQLNMHTEENREGYWDYLYDDNDDFKLRCMM